MHDMLVRLYALPSLDDAVAASARLGVDVRRALEAEAAQVVSWVRAQFSSSAAEVSATFSRTPVTCFIAVREQRIVGFACYDVTCPNFFGPEGVIEHERGRGIGRTLLLCALHAQRAQGYGYAIIGGVGPAEFYAKTVGAIPIPGSTPGIYAGRLARNPPGGNPE